MIGIVSALYITIFQLREECNVMFRYFVSKTDVVDEQYTNNIKYSFLHIYQLDIKPFFPTGKRLFFLWKQHCLNMQAPWCNSNKATIVFQDWYWNTAQVSWQLKQAVVPTCLKSTAIIPVSKQTTIMTIIQWPWHQWWGVLSESSRHTWRATLHPPWTNFSFNFIHVEPFKHKCNLKCFAEWNKT